MKIFEKERQELASGKVVIICVENKNLSCMENQFRNIKLSNKLFAMGANYTEGKQFAGEQSGIVFFCKVDSYSQARELASLACLDFFQERVLLRDSCGVHLLYLQDCEQIGQVLKAVPAAIARDNGGYFLVSERHYIVA